MTTTLFHISTVRRHIRKYPNPADRPWSHGLLLTAALVALSFLVCRIVFDMTPYTPGNYPAAPELAE